VDGVLTEVVGQVAKPLMTRYARTFSKGNPSTLTKELLAQTDVFFPVQTPTTTSRFRIPLIQCSHV